MPDASDLVNLLSVYLPASPHFEIAVDTFGLARRRSAFVLHLCAIPISNIPRSIDLEYIFSSLSEISL
jgi:hypothetical protein